jgi:hypothetical protein
MSATSAPFGFRPAYQPIGLDRAKKYTIASAYGTAIYKNKPVILNTNGTIVDGTAAADLLGVFAGVEYTDAQGKPNYSNYWPAGQVATNITAWVYDDPTNVYEVQADGSIPATAIGDQADMSNATAGSAQTGLSAARACRRSSASSGSASRSTTCPVTRSRSCKCRSLASSSSPTRWRSNRAPHE